jgi:hypothetical protein
MVFKESMNFTTMSWRTFRSAAFLFGWTGRLAQYSTYEARTGADESIS